MQRATSAAVLALAACAGGPTADLAPGGTTSDGWVSLFVGQAARDPATGEALFGPVRIDPASSRAILRIEVVVFDDLDGDRDAGAGERVHTRIVRREPSAAERVFDVIRLRPIRSTLARITTDVEGLDASRTVWVELGDLRFGDGDRCEGGS